MAPVRRPLLFVGQLVLLTFILAAIIVPLIAAMSEIPNRPQRLPTRPPTTVASTTTAATTTTTTTTGATTTTTATTASGTLTTTTAMTVTGTTATTATTHPTTTTHVNTTTAATTPLPTTPAPPTCGSCATSAINGPCSSQYAACSADFVNCRIQCFNTFYFDNYMPYICFNGAIPSWPPLLACLCSNFDGNCGALCPSDCNFTAPGTTEAPTISPVACMNCYNTNTAPEGPCFTQAQTCANSTACELLCADFYAADIPVFSSCTMNVTNSTIPEWPPLSDCLCPYCNADCPLNNRTC